MTFELINTITTNSLGSFDSADAARDAYWRFAASDRRFARELVLIAFNDEGEAVEELSVDEPAVEPLSASREPRAARAATSPRTRSSR